MERQRHAGLEEIFYVVQGEGVVQAGMDSAAIRKGDAIPIMINEEHACVNTGTTDLEFMVIGIAMDKDKDKDKGLSRAATMVIAGSRAGADFPSVSSNLPRSAFSLPRTPLSAASIMMGSAPCFVRRSAIGVSRDPGGSAPSDAATCCRTDQSASSIRSSIAACTG